MVAAAAVISGNALSSSVAAPGLECRMALTTVAHLRFWHVQIAQPQVEGLLTADK
jgi:hypothetical protein